MQKKKTFLAISIVIPMRNSSSTIIETLKSIKKQTYPIKEIIIVDNASTDNSTSLVEQFAKQNKGMYIRLLKNKIDIFIARSLVRGVTAAKNPYVVFIQSDCKLITSKEIDRLMTPFLSDPSVVATYGQTHQSLDVWYHYAFWEQFLFAYQAGKTCTGLLGKIDCIKKDAYMKIGGHDGVLCSQYGAEDADIHLRLKQVGKTVETKASIIHLHYIYKDFSFMDLLKKKEIIAGAYGIMMGKYGLKYEPLGIFTGLIKPVLAVGLLIPQTRLIAVVLTIFFIFKYYWRMFTTISVAKNPQIILVPFAFVLLLYLETLWTAKAFMHGLFSPKNAVLKST